jgi:hypothetical protein
VVSVIAYKLVDIVIGLRVPEEEEREGLDITTHGESAYHANCNVASMLHRKAPCGALFYCLPLK